MLKFNLQRVMATGLAMVTTITLSGCNNNLDDITSTTPESSAITDENILESPVVSPYVVIIDKERINNDTIWKVKEEDFASMPNLPIVVPIDEIVLYNGEIAYIMPEGYTPYLVDKTKPMPEETEEIKMDGYVFKYAVPITYADGTSGHLGFSGAVAIYTPYYNALKLLQDYKSDFYAQYYEAKKSSTENSALCEIFAQTLELEDIAEELYYDINGERGRS